MELTNMVMYFLLLLLCTFACVLKSKTITIALWILLLGVMSNQVVIHANHGRMPVFYEYPLVQSNNVVYLDSRHQNGTPETRYGFLGDIFDIESFGLVSIGDILMTLSILIAVVRMFFFRMGSKKTSFFRNNSPFSYPVIFVAMIAPYIVIVEYLNFCM